jgi:Glycosyl transferase family 2
MSARTTVFCAVWSGDPDRRELLRGHIESLRNQSVPISMIYVFDDGDDPPDWVDGAALIAADPLTIYQAWNVAVRHATTDYVMNLNLDDRLAPDAVETMEQFADANGAGLVAADWSIRYSQADTDDVKETYRASSLPFDPAWPPQTGARTRLGSGTGDRGTLGPATLWRRSLHDQAPYPWQFASGKPIRIVGDLAWWTIIRQHLEAPVVRLPLIIGNYHSHPGEQAEFRSADEHHLLSSEGIQMGWFPLDRIKTTTEHE